MDSNTNHYDYQGLVIGTAAPEFRDFETDLVLLLRSERERFGQPSEIYGVGKQAFVPPDVECDFANIENAKNLERRYATPLIFGDLIEWNEVDCDRANRRILRFRRQKPLYEVGSSVNGCLLKVGGVIEPRNRNTFWNPLQTVAIPSEDAWRAETDVWLNAWLRVECPMKTSSEPFDLSICFEKFDSCEHTDQGRVSEAPWHRNSVDSKFSTWLAEPTPCDSDDEIDLIPPDNYKVENKWAEKIEKQLGLFVGDRLIICKELAQYDFIIPLVLRIGYASDRSEIYPNVGEYFHFSAVWSNLHRCFLVTDYMKVPTLRSHYATMNGIMHVDVHPAHQKGFFVDPQESLGLIDDPHHCLSFMEFHPATTDSFRLKVEIRAVRSSENRSVRYRIVARVDEDEMMMKNFLRWMDDAEFAVGPLEGLVINRDTVLSAEHPNVLFRLKSNYPEGVPAVGGGIRFRGKRMAGTKNEIQITEWLHSNKCTTPKMVESGENRIFQMMLKPVPGLEQLAYSDIVGYVDMRTMNCPNGEFRAWVRESQFLGDCRRACTILEVFSLALTVPILPVWATSSGRNSVNTTRSETTLDDSPEGSFIEGTMTSRNSRNSAVSVSNRFMGPKSSTSQASSQRSTSSYK